MKIIEDSMGKKSYEYSDQLILKKSRKIFKNKFLSNEVKLPLSYIMQVKQKTESYNEGHNIFGLFNILPNFRFSTLETKHGY